MTNQVTVWSSDAYPADEPPLRLPAAPSDSYMMRVAAGHVKAAGDDLDQFADNYYSKHGEAAIGLERFVIALWPAVRGTDPVMR